jgi:hypothetical protein
MSPTANARAFQEQGSVTSTITRKVTVWGVDPGFPGGQQLTLCNDDVGKIYMVFRSSAMGTSQPEVGEIWLINRTLGLWTFMTRLAVTSPIVLVVTSGYEMTGSNRFVIANVPSGESFTIKFPPPQAAVQGELYGMRNTAAPLTPPAVYSGGIAIAPNTNETISGPTLLGATTGAQFVTDNNGWYCVSMTVL